MARLAAFAASLLSFSIVIFVLHCQEIQSAEIQEYDGRHLLDMPGIPVAPVVPLNCTNECNRRCELAGRHKLCVRFCNLCCNECHCVPSGHAGNKDECPCYRDKMNSKNGTKCP